MNKGQKEKQTKKLCMYFCMNAYMVSFINVDFCGLEVPALVSGFVKEIPEFSQLSQKLSKDCSEKEYGNSGIL